MIIIISGVLRFHDSSSNLYLGLFSRLYYNVGLIISRCIVRCAQRLECRLAMCTKFRIHLVSIVS